MQNLLEEAVDSSFDEGVQCERARCADLLKLLQPATLELIRTSILNGAEAVDVFDEALALMSKPTASAVPDDESVLRNQAAVMRRAFSRAAGRVSGPRAVFSSNRVTPESDS